MQDVSPLSHRVRSFDSPNPLLLDHRGTNSRPSSLAITDKPRRVVKHYSGAFLLEEESFTRMLHHSDAVNMPHNLRKRQYQNPSGSTPLPPYPQSSCSSASLPTPFLEYTSFSSQSRISRMSKDSCSSSKVNSNPALRSISTA